MLDIDSQGFVKSESARFMHDSCPFVPEREQTFTRCDRPEGLLLMSQSHAFPMSRILLIPIAVILAAGGVVLGPGEDTPASPAQTSTTPTSQSGIHATFR